MDRIEFENSNAIERSEQIHGAERVRGDRQRGQPEKRKRRRKWRRRHEEPEEAGKGSGEKKGKNLDIEA